MRAPKDRGVLGHGDRSTAGTDDTVVGPCAHDVINSPRHQRSTGTRGPDSTQSWARQPARFVRDAAHRSHSPPPLPCASLV